MAVKSDGELETIPANPDVAAAKAEAALVATTVPPEGGSVPVARDAGPLAFTLPPVGGMYAVQRELGRGGIGRVLVARDRRLGREVALKLLQQPAEAIAARFEREARITAHLQHPGIVPIYEAGRLEDGEPFYAMKLVSGRPFDAVLDDARTTAARLALLPHIVAVADALAYAHAKRIVHRDLKPQNIIVGDFGETVVIDWGLAKDLDDDSEPAEAAAAPFRDGDEPTLTLAGTVMGTPAYMAPEQARGEAVDERADVFAIGAVLYQVLAGRLVYGGRTVAELLAGAIGGERAPSLRGRADLPPDLVAIVEKAIDPDRDVRYATAKTLAEDLHAFANGQLVGVHRYTLGQHVRRWARKHRTAVAIGAVAAIALAAVSVVGILQIRSERATAVGQRDEAERQRKEADRQRGEADLANVLMLEDQARRELAAGHAPRAIPFLAESHRLRPDRIQTRILAGEALRKVAAPTLAIDTPACPPAFASDHARVVYVCQRDKSYELVAFDLRTGKQLATVVGAGERVELRTFGARGDRFVLHTEGSRDGHHVRGFVVYETSSLRKLGASEEDGWATELTHDGKFVVRARMGGGLEARDAETGAVVARLDGELSGAAIYPQPNGMVVIHIGTAAGTGKAIAWNTATWVASRFDVSGFLVRAFGDHLVVHRRTPPSLVRLELATGRELATIAVEESASAPVVSASGKYTAYVVGKSARVSTWTDGYATVRNLHATKVAFAPEHDLVVAGSDTHAEVVGLDGRASPDMRLAPGDVAFSPSGARFALMTPTGFRAYERSGHLIAEVELGAQPGVAHFVDEDRVALGSHVYALARGAYVHGAAQPPPGTLGELSGATGERAVLVAGDDGTYSVELPSLRVTRIHDRRTGAAAFGANGRVLMSTKPAELEGKKSTYLHGFDPATKALHPFAEQPTKFGVPGIKLFMWNGFDLSADRKRAVGTTISSNIGSIDLERGTWTYIGTVHNLGGTNMFPHARISPDGKLALYEYSDDKGRARLIDLERNEIRAHLPGEGKHGNIEFALSNDVAAVGSVLFDTKTGARLRTLAAGGYQTFDPTGARIAVGGGTTVTIFEVATGRRINDVHFSRGVGSFAFSPDGKLLVASGEHGIHIAEVEGGELAMLASGTYGQVAFARDGNHVLATGYAHWTVWRVPTLEDRAPLDAALARVPWQLVDRRLLPRR